MRTILACSTSRATWWTISPSCWPSNRDLDEQRGATAGRAGHVECAADRLDAVAEAGQSGPLGGVGSPDPVVADRQPHDRVQRVEFDVHDRSAACLTALASASDTA